MTRASGSRRRRAFLLRSLGLGAAGLVPGVLDDAPARQGWHRHTGRLQHAALPPTVISLADHGGAPGAGPAVLIDAFQRAFGVLAAAGGGTLFVPAGVYDFGRHADATTIILCRNLRNVVVLAYGATFTVTTTANVMPNLFYFFNFTNITIVGASFADPGFSPYHDWRGLVCVGIQADAASAGFTMVDCYAEHVVSLLTTHNNAHARHYLSDISVQGEVRSSYYGVGASYIRKNVHVDLVCHNVRRAFIAYSLHRARIVVSSSCTPNWPGSNGLVALVSAGASMGNVDDVQVRVDVEGACIHDSIVHFYHQGPQAQGHMRDIDATVNLRDAECTRQLFVFDHEVWGILPRTTRVWDRIALHGNLGPRFSGRVVANKSVSTSPGTVYLDRNLARLADMKALPAGFRARPARFAT
jgi:hypothetical protein